MIARCLDRLLYNRNGRNTFHPFFQATLFLRLVYSQSVEYMANATTAGVLRATRRLDGLCREVFDALPSRRDGPIIAEGCGTRDMIGGKE